MNGCANKIQIASTLNNGHITRNGSRRQGRVTKDGTSLPRRKNWEYQFLQELKRGKQERGKENICLLNIGKTFLMD